MKKLILIPIIILSLILGGCTDASLDASGKIIPPKIQVSPLQGKWFIEKGFDKDFKTVTEKKFFPLIGKTAEFAKDAVMVGDYFWTNPEYKIKKAKSDEYFILKYQKPPEKLGIQDKDIIIVTITSYERFIYEFIKISENECLAEIDGCLYYLRKTSDEVDSDFTQKVSRENIPENSMDIEKNNKTPISGVFIGLKSPENASGNNTDYKYRTIFIESINRSLKTPVQTDNIFFPRKSGFWKLEVKKSVAENRSEDIIMTYDTSGDTIKDITPSSENSSIWSDRIGTVKRSILSVCNDYISVETSGSGKYNDKPGFWSENRLQLQPVESVNTPKGISIEDAAGSIGLKALNDARQNYINTLGASEINEFDQNYYLEDFALARKTGHWFFKGRINYIKNSQFLSGDFNINLMPSSKIILYDTLFIPWTSIKDAVPEAVDAYTSPNKDIALIVTSKYILIYNIEGGALSGSPVQKIKLGEGESVIMSEWATGDYVYNWERNFYKNNVKQAE